MTFLLFLECVEPGIRLMQGERCWTETNFTLSDARMRGIVNVKLPIQVYGYEPTVIPWEASSGVISRELLIARHESRLINSVGIVMRCGS
jgi:hypothetical protein